MISLQVFGVEATSAYFRDGIRLFKLEQRKKMRQAAKLVKRDVQAKVRSLFAPRTKPRYFAAGHGSATNVRGPLAKKIVFWTFDTASSVQAMIAQGGEAFYGAFHETGLNTTRKGRHRGKYFQRSGRGREFVVRNDSKPFHLPRRPFLEPVAKADTSKVVSIMGESYGVFYRGGA
jgi:phage gpG-like protein